MFQNSRYLVILSMFVLTLFQMLAVSASAAALTVEGRVFTESGPLPEAKVYAYRSYTDMQGGKSPVALALTDNKGVYKLALDTGAYYFIARGESEGRKYYAYHGANPIKIGGEKMWLGLLANPESQAAAYVDGAEGIEGRILYKGKPVDGAYIALHNPESKNFKALGVKTESAASDGSFKVNARPGRYVVQARKIAGGLSNRPAQKGDLYCYNSNNPIEVREGKTARFDLSCYPVTDRAAFATAPTVKDDDIKTFADRRSSFSSGIRGRVTNTSGKPMAGLSVLAYQLTAPVTQMYFFAHGTEYSSVTDEAGRFFIPVDEDGDYGLQARDVLGDGPHRGEIFGLYQGNSRYAVPFKKGTIVDNISIIADKVMQPPKETGSRKPAIVVGTTVGAPVVLPDSVVADDTVWQGEIHVAGVISIKRGATLTIRPGTIVKFKRIDRDRNNIGDSEIMVEGRLVAKGTGDKKIIFTSAEEKPKVNDWSFVQFISSDPDNVIENCQFEYAFVGVMIHFANVNISDSLFRNNGRGLHYTSTDMLVEHCTFTDNRVGIYFTRFEGDVRITGNEISRNDIGVQFVRQHINVVDYDRADQGKEAPLYRDNNIHQNRKYNFSIGEGETRDIVAANNWWGSAVKESIGETLYDRSKDGTLGRVHFEPFLKKPVKGAGMHDAH